MKIKINKNKNIKDYIKWSVWECKPSVFPWQYDNEEHCYIIEGSAKITTSIETVIIKKGDYVVFPKDLKCSWKVLGKIKKYYTFK